MRRRTAGLVALALALVLPAAPAEAAAYKCKKTATVKSGDLLRFTDFAEPGAPVTAGTVAAAARAA